MSDSGDPKQDKQRELEAEREFYAHPKKSESIELREILLAMRANDLNIVANVHKMTLEEAEQTIEALYNQRMGVAESDGRIKEHEEWVLPITEAAHSWEQDGEGSGIQYFDSERLDRYKQLKATRAGINKKEDGDEETRS